MLKLSASVGKGGKNRPHDVAKLQATFTAIGFQQKKHVIDGKMNSFEAEIHRYLMENPIRKPSKWTYKNRIDPKGPIIEGLRKKLKGSLVERLQAIWGTPILYSPRQGNRTRRASSDFLIPPYLSLPRIFHTRKSSYIGHIDDVIFINTPTTTGKFDVTMSLGGVGQFLDPQKHKLLDNPPPALKTFIEQELKITGKKWSYLPAKTNGSHFKLRSINVAELGQRVSTIGPGTFGQRVIWGDLRDTYRIPRKDKLLNAVGRIHAEVCASTGEQGGAAYNKALSDYAATVLEQSLNSNVVAGQKRHCASCRDLQISLESELGEIEEKRKAQEKRQHKLNAFIVRESNERDVKHARIVLKKAGANLVPFFGDVIFNVEKSEQEEETDRVKTFVEFYLELRLKWGRENKLVRQLSRVLTLFDLAVATAAIINLGVELIESAFTDPILRAEVLKAQQDIYNLELEIEAAEIRQERLIKDFAARKCASWGYSPNAVQGTVNPLS